jgi:hypothetical protein
MLRAAKSIEQKVAASGKTCKILESYKQYRQLDQFQKAKAAFF